MHDDTAGVLSAIGGRYNFENVDVLRNKYVTDYDKETSSVLTRHSYDGVGSVYPDYPAIDNISIAENEFSFFVDDKNRAP